MLFQFYIKPSTVIYQSFLHWLVVFVNYLLCIIPWLHSFTGCWFVKLLFCVSLLWLEEYFILFLDKQKKTWNLQIHDKSIAWIYVLLLHLNSLSAKIYYIFSSSSFSAYLGQKTKQKIVGSLGAGLIVFTILVVMSNYWIFWT